MALKEWAVVCRALALGQQIITLRKGGVHEPGGVFRAEYDEFWLYPTYEHQRREELAEAAWPLLDTLESFLPKTPGQLALSLYARVVLAHEVTNLEAALSLRGLHVWTDEVIRQRYAHRRPGLCVLALRVYQMPGPHQLPELARYAGCRSWVELERPLLTTGSEPVLSEDAFLEKLGVLKKRLGLCGAAPGS